MEAFEVVRLFVNKMVVPAEPRRRGDPGYGRLKALRVLVYSRLNGLENDTRIAGYLGIVDMLLDLWACQAYLTGRRLEGGGDATSACRRRFLKCFPVSSNS